MMIRELYVSPEAAGALLADSARLPAWTLDARQAGDLALLMNGAYAPLRGYMTQADHDAVQGGAVSPWPVPLALQVDADFAARVQPGDDIALRDDGGVVAVMSVTDAWGDPALLGGKVKGLRRPVVGSMTPNALRTLFADRGKARVLGVQPDRPEQIAPALRAARDLDALLLIQPLPGVAVDAPTDAVLSPLPVAPPTGPRAALWQALVARNHGATHLMLFDAAGRELYRPHEVSIGVRMVEPGRMA
ncbi:transcription antiterminator BlgG [Paracoccus sp. WLY502]|uniref:transcription antiterminator BlgG n=1 Tax=Paracoccus yibinensis TaxID=3068891 RepID=UPI00279646B3|nr:transcription antiterminator BlgG [Paracoccus sp. WLY502]MDQ1899858.1 transcription antiterminator BlgG [Paracoccus sp. WLY502]